MRRNTLASVLMALVCTAGCAAQTEDGDVASIEEALGHFGRGGDPLIHQDHPLGAFLYEQLAKGWLRWAMGQPYSTGPITDPTGASCGIDQHGPVFYLAGTDGGPATRECTIPRNKALYFPLINSWAIPPEEFVDTPEELEAFIEFGHRYFPENREFTCTLTLRLDGEEVLADTAERDEELWTDVLEPFPVVLDDDNFSGGPGGFRSSALTGGHYALLKPLSRGDHTLELGGVQCEGEEIFFETSATYTLHVR
jgi:hypothetical protein